MPSLLRFSIPVQDYDLTATLTSGQAFRWKQAGPAWEGVIHSRWLRLTQSHTSIDVELAAPEDTSDWLTTYLQADVNLKTILRTFPEDAPLKASLEICRGLRVLRQDPWECLASFILSSSKQIRHIEEIVERLCHRYGAPLPVPENHEPVFSFPKPRRIAECTEAELRNLKMGYRAPYLRDSARMIASGEVDLARLHHLSLPEAREELIRLPGVGRKIADCVLLFAYGFQEAFPVDVWIFKALKEFYFPRRRVKPARMLAFAESHFGPHAGYAQQYLYHYIRVLNGKAGKPPHNKVLPPLT